MMRWNSRCSAGSSLAASSSSVTRRALDRDQGLAQFVAHQAQELGPQPFDLVERREVLDGDHHRADGVAVGADWRGVDQHPGAAPVRHREYHLLRAHRLAATDYLLDGEPAQAHLAAVGAAHRHHLQELLGRLARPPQALRDTPRLAV